MFGLYTCKRRCSARLGADDVEEIWNNMVGKLDVEDICSEIDSDNVKHIKIVITKDAIEIRVDFGDD